MKKKFAFNNKGFMLIETLLVSLTIASILIYMYAQFSTIDNSYQRLYRYNTADSLYRVGVLREFILYNNTESSYVYNGLGAKSVGCDDFSSGASQTFCNKIITAIGADKIILTTRDFNDDDVLEAVGSNRKQKAQMERYIKAINREGTGRYRLIIMFDDNTIASVLFDK